VVRGLGIMICLVGCGFRSSIETGDATTGDGPRDGSDIVTPTCDIAATWAGGLTPTATIYVAATAAGPQDGSVAHPFARMSQALPVAPGTLISLAAGSYPSETLTDLHGSAAAPIFIEGSASGARARLMNGASLHLVRPQYVVLRHLDLAAVGGAGINADDAGDVTHPVAHHLVIEDVNITGATTGVQLSGVSEVAIRTVTATNVSKGVIMVGVHHASLARVTVTSALIACVQASGGSDDIEVRQSKLASCSRSLWLGGDSSENEFRPPLASTNNAEVSNVRAFDNVLLGADTFVMCSICTNVLVASSYLFGDPPAPTGTRYIVRLYQEHPAINGHAFVPAGGVRFVDNAITVTSHPSGLQVDPMTDGASCRFDHNLWYESDTPDTSMSLAPGGETGGIYGMPSGYLLDGTTLCTSGAATGAGVAVPEAPGTSRGTCRPNPPSIGPSEPSC
jgi:hypothetical protein